jgi:hypothetical protein
VEKPAHKPEFPPLLPQGFHSLTSEEVMELCVTAFPGSIDREGIMAGLQSILDRIKELDMVCEVWLDGSFITQKVEPDDVDFIVFAPMAILQTENPQLAEFIDWMNDNEDEPKKLFKCHTQIVFEDAQNQYANDLIGDTRKHYEEVFGFSVSTHEPKGIVVLNLTVPEVEEEEQIELELSDVIDGVEPEKGDGV